MRWAAAVLLLAAAPAWGQASGQSGGAWQPRGAATLVLLDKMRAVPSTVEVKVGGSTSLGTLTIKVRGCVARPADQPADSAAFLEVTDSRAAASGFKGWILANTPSVSQFEDPLYDVRLISCR